MLFDRYEAAGLLFNMNFKEATTEAGKAAYRGELVLVEGEVGDSAGRRKPPTIVMKQAAALADGDSLVFVSGLLDRLDQLPLLFQRFGADMAANATLMLFVVNIPDPIRTEYEGKACTLVPLQDGMTWNALLDELKLEKSDFKGQSAGDKVLTVVAACADYAPGYPAKTWDEALAVQNDARREARGPV